MPATMVHSVYTSLVWSTMYRRKSGISVLAGSIKRPLGWDDFRPMLTHVNIAAGASRMSDRLGASHPLTSGQGVGPAPDLASILVKASAIDLRRLHAPSMWGDPRDYFGVSCKGTHKHASNYACSSSVFVRLILPDPATAP